VLRAGVRGSTAVAPGSGLGLASALAAMRAQGGSLELSDRTGGGTRVTITLPAVDADVRALAS
jgi:signal transduction histidine kinase